MCVVMLRILNFSYINGKSNDLFTKKSTRNQKYNNCKTEKLENYIDDMMEVDQYNSTTDDMMEVD